MRTNLLRSATKTLELRSSMRCGVTMRANVVRAATKSSICSEAAPPRRSRLSTAQPSVFGSGARTSYIGREHDKETDLGFYGVRLYEPEYGRFLSTDVLWGAQLSLQPYHYAINNPVNAADASGLFSIGEHVEIDMAARQMAGLSTGLLAQVQSTIYHTIQDIPLSIVSSIHLDNMDNGEMQSWLSSGGYESSGAHTLQDFYCHSNYIEVMSGQLEEGQTLDCIPTLDELKAQNPEKYDAVVKQLETTTFPNDGARKTHDLADHPSKNPIARGELVSPTVFSSKHSDHKPFFELAKNLAIRATAHRLKQQATPTVEACPSSVQVKQ